MTYFVLVEIVHDFFRKDFNFKIFKQRNPHAALINLNSGIFKTNVGSYGKNYLFAKSV